MSEYTAYEKILENEMSKKNDRIAELEKTEANLICEIYDHKKTIMRYGAIVTTLVGIIALMMIVIAILGQNLKDLEREHAAISLGTTVERIKEMEKSGEADAIYKACGMDIDGATPDYDLEPEAYK